MKYIQDNYLVYLEADLLDLGLHPKEVMETYQHVIEALRSVWDTQVLAEELKNAYEKGLAPSLWMERIRLAEEMEKLD